MDEKSNVYKIEPMGDDHGKLHERGENESLSDYLEGINSYISDMNEHYGINEKKDESSEVVFSSKSGEVPVKEVTPVHDDNVVFDSKTEEMNTEEETLYTEKYTEPQDKPVEESEEPENSGEEYDEPEENVGKFRKIFGDSRFTAVTSIINAAAYIVWIIGYVVCLFEREAYFAQYEANMLSKGVTSYHIEISTPFFTVLKIFLYLMPVIMILWTVAVVVADKKGKRLASKKTLVGLFGLDAVIGITAIIDIAYAGLLFT